MTDHFEIVILPKLCRTFVFSRKCPQSAVHRLGILSEEGDTHHSYLGEEVWRVICNGLTYISTTITYTFRDFIRITERSRHGDLKRDASVGRFVDHLHPAVLHRFIGASRCRP